jgi:hypothetical protein
METKGDIREAPALGGFGVPTEALAKLQADYMAGAMEVWNRVLQPDAAPKRPADRRFAASEWSASPVYFGRSSASDIRCPFPEGWCG